MKFKILCVAALCAVATQHVFAEDVAWVAREAARVNAERVEATLNGKSKSEVQVNDEYIESVSLEYTRRCMLISIMAGRSTATEHQLTKAREQYAANGCEKVNQKSFEESVVQNRNLLDSMRNGKRPDSLF